MSAVTKPSGIESVLPLAPLQQGMLFHTLYVPGAAVYNLQLELVLEGDLDEAALEQAWQLLVARHAVLRTSFVWNRVEKPYQVVHSRTELRIARHDLRGASGEQQGERRRAILLEEREKVFDLARPPLMRLALLALSERKSVLLWTFHHIVLEGWSAAIVLDDLWKCYAALCARKDPALPAVRPYSDFIRWLQRKDQGAAEVYWREKLRGFELPTRLPIDRAAGNAPAEVRKTEVCSSTLPLEFAGALKDLARAHRVTLNTVIQGAWSILLSRYSGDRDVVFGAVLSGRTADLPGADSMVGMLVNTLPARVKVEPDALLGPWLQALQLDQVEMRQYEHCSLMQVQAWSEVPSGAPLFHTVLAFQNWLGDFPSGQMTPELNVAVGETFDSSDQPLHLQVVTGEELTLNLMYDFERFERPVVARMLAHCLSLLRGMVADSHRRLSELPMLDAAERRQLLEEWNGLVAPLPAGELAHSAFEAQALRTPQRVALVGGGEQVSYFGLEEKASRIANVLRARGIGRGERVGLCLERGPQMMAALLGVLKAGAAYVPLDPMFPQERLRFMAQDAQLALLVSTEELSGLFDMPRERQLLLDADAQAVAAAPAMSLPKDARSARPEDPAYVIYTSGSTGKPKGVVVPHRAVVNFLASMAREPGLAQADVLLAVTTLSFDIAVLELQLPLTLGAKVVLASREEAVDGQALAKLIEHQGVTVMQATPTTWRLLLEAGWRGKEGFKALVGGEALPRDLAEQLLGRRVELWNMYGPTETTVWSTCARVADSSKPITIGGPIANTTVRILDAQLGLCPIGVPGELCIGGDGVALGYWNRPQLTAERFIAEPFSPAPGTRLYRTGDLARWRDDGTLEHLGRLDFQVKVRGYRIELGEIEAALAQHPAVKQAIVAAREDQPGDKRLVAYVVVQDAPADLPEQLRTLLRKSMPEYMVPAHFVRLEAMPLTPNGKVDRKALPRPQEGDLAAPANTYVAPGSDLEMALASAWQKVLGLERVGVRDNFFDLGGNSLTAIKLTVEMKQATGFDLPLGAIFRSPTVAELAASLGPDAKENLSVVVPLQGEGKGIPVFCICGVNIYKHFAGSLGKDQPVYGVYVAEEQGLAEQVMRGEKPVISIERLVDAYYEAIARFAPKGPYRLAGLSFGGLLAMELASKIRKAGHEVELVFLLDAVLPGGHRVSWRKWISHQAKEVLEGRGVEKLRRLLRGSANVESGAGKPNGAGKVSHYIDERFGRNQEAAYVAAAEKWRAQEPVFDFPAVLFRASDVSMWGGYAEFAEDYGWRRYLGDRLSIVQVIGGHRSIIEPPNVAELGRVAQQYMRGPEEAKAA